MSGLHEIKLAANAKINLTLDITGKRPDGYHLLDMVNRSVDLCDEVTLTRAKSGETTVRSNARFLPGDERNLALRAARALADATGAALPALDIFIKKRIPTQAGLGGGSADAAAVLVGLNDMLELGLTQKELCDIGETVGADVPFCVAGGAARVQGIGEVITPIDDNCDYSVVISMPKHGRSTREAFAAFDSGAAFHRPDTDALLRCLADGDTGGMAIHLLNVFCSAAPDEETYTLIAYLLSRGALGASMSGSGAAVFGIFADILDARRCCTALRARGLRVYATRPADQGVMILHKK